MEQPDKIEVTGDELLWLRGQQAEDVSDLVLLPSCPAAFAHVDMPAVRFAARAIPRCAGRFAVDLHGYSMLAK